MLRESSVWGHCCRESLQHCPPLTSSVQPSPSMPINTNIPHWKMLSTPPVSYLIWPIILDQGDTVSGYPIIKTLSEEIATLHSPSPPEPSVCPQVGELESVLGSPRQGRGMGSGELQGWGTWDTWG